MSIPNLRLIDLNNNVYNFPTDFWISDDPFETKKNVIDHAFSAGGEDTGDGYIRPRFITIGGQIRGNTPAEFDAAYQNFMRAILKGGILEKSVDAVSRYIEVKSPDVQTGAEEFRQYKEITVTFLAEYPLWKDSTETSDPNVMSGNGDISIDLSESSYIVKPVIEIEADQGADVPSIKLTNLNDGGLGFTYNNPNFFSGAVLTIDCAKGTVRLNNNNAIEYLTEGVSAFIRLQPIINNISYEGAACTITFKYRKVYI